MLKKELFLIKSSKQISVMSQSKGNPNLSSTGGGWGSRPSAGGGGWGSRPSHSIGIRTFTIAIIEALLLIPGVTKTVADDFTVDYIREHPIQSAHTQRDIDDAVALFQKRYRHRHSDNPDNLFKRLLKQGRSLRHVEEKDLVSFTKRYIEGLSPDVIDTPTSDDIRSAFQALNDAFPPPGIKMFQDVTQFGISPETVGKEIFDQVLSALFKGLIYAMLKPSITLERMQGLICQDAPFVCTLAGVQVHVDGSFKLFKQNRHRATVYDDSVVFIIFWIDALGSMRMEEKQPCKHKKQLTGHQFLPKFGFNYDDSGNRSHALPRMMEKSTPVILLPQDSSHIIPIEGPYEEYKEMCDIVVGRLGGIPVSFISVDSPVTEVVTPAAAGEDATITLCRHMNIVLSNEKSTQCATCISESGKDPIRNGWGDIVGYKTPK